MRPNPANWRTPGRLLKRFACDIGGATAIEYGIIAAGVGATIAATIWQLGSTIEDTLYNKINDAIK